MWIFIALAAIPIVEIALFIEIGGAIGLWPTIALIVLTAIVGGVLMRTQGFVAMRRLQIAMAEGGDPRGPLANGAMILVAGVLMLTPGFFTDTLGFLLLLPPVRTALINWIGPKLAAGAFHVSAGRPESSSDGPIDAEYEDVTETDKPRPPSGWTLPPR
ncbi:FxsA family protein [Pikeienuella sp. HZG-20]|uniref:FxsA family protein n=1 Tax=Paludibacillus litoralis TaxID=3133267 RepID=UPI0030EBB0A0